MTCIPSLVLEALEDRLAPASANVWADATHLTVSFVADGTQVGNQTSSLYSTLDSTQSTEAWQAEILLALQTWAAEADISLTVVEEEPGYALGTAGAIQGDPRFGDIRIAAVSLGDSSVATAVPFSSAQGTWSGDLLLNTDYFGAAAQGSYDLTSVLLHEAGHVFGLEDVTDDASSVMYHRYTGLTSLSAADIQQVQAAYGQRLPDRFEENPKTGTLDNDTLETATRFGRAARISYRQDLREAETLDQAAEIVPFVIEADLSTGQDVDHFRYRTPLENRGFAVTVETAGMSLANVQLTVLDDQGNIVGSAVTDRSGWAEVYVPEATGRVYYFRIEGAEDNAFGVGAYRLQVTPDNPEAYSILDNVYQTWLDGDSTNDTVETADRLRRLINVPGEGRTFGTEGRLSTEDAVDVYAVKAPNVAQGKSLALDVTVWGIDGDPAPNVVVYDSLGVAVAYTVIRQDATSLTIRIDQVSPTLDYYVAVSSSQEWGGLYGLLAEYRVVADPAAPQLTGTVTADTSPQVFHSFDLATGQLVQLDVGIEASDTSAETAALVSILDASGEVVYETTVVAGQTQSISLWLAEGGYTVRLAFGRSDGTPPPATETTGYALSLTTLSEPIGPSLIDYPEDLPPDQSTWVEEIYTSILAFFDPYGTQYGTLDKWY